ncbi:MAG: hypothetical protein HY879_24510 [Deltaproteobacteria bacterium]|nr:hypothetical protein [Deltaproteobacteria bacterium]
METQTDFLKRLLKKLSESGIPFMLVGSVAASYHGYPRTTMDIDTVVEADLEDLHRFARSLGEGYYVSEEEIDQAVLYQRAFNIIDKASGYKADLIIRKNRPFSRTEFSRRFQIEILGIIAGMATPEDVILSKLEWSKLGSSERQWQDALKVAQTRAGNLDLDYIGKWSGELGVHDLWQRIKEIISKT